ncbi:hypothetical protein CFK37_07600 [Virgibacillus phasianinus]|uniref:Uncharacterized protein n=1 Tax=Virgibacillus phasianinus TaxID=2017483 RepID=A0A220U218_9BACI|nr:hypothetical protein [Virgibacillus phasianinus]ASK62032.1 hypothetical protein CFK37_07600 [Virgibacillus phasianinus]
MRHPYEKFIRLELLTLILAVIAGIVVLIKGFIFLAIVLIYLIACALCCEAMIELHTHNRNKAFKHFIQVILLFVFTTYIVFHL